MPIVKKYHQTRLALGSDTTLMLATDLSENLVNQILISYGYKSLNLKENLVGFYLTANCLDSIKQPV